LNREPPRITAHSWAALSPAPEGEPPEGAFLFQEVEKMTKEQVEEDVKKALKDGPDGDIAMLLVLLHRFNQRYANVLKALGREYEKAREMEDAAETETRQAFCAGMSEAYRDALEILSRKDMPEDGGEEAS
jgi:hypothetical protein